MVESLQLTPILVAVIALAGGFLTALLGWIGNSRSKYIEVIAAQRIKWVGEIREDFRLFLAACQAMHDSRLERRASQELREAQNKETNFRSSIIALKLNSTDPDDCRILRAVGKLMHAAAALDTETFVKLQDYLGLLVNFKLKDEWEKAKSEAAGPVRWAWLAIKGRARSKRRKQMISASISADILGAVDSPMSREEKFLRPLPSERA